MNNNTTIVGGLNNKKRFILGLLSSVLGIIIIFFVIISLGIYKFNWNNNFIYAVTKIFPFPAASIDGDKITVYEVNKDLEALKLYNNSGAMQLTDATDLTDIALEKLIEDKLVAMAAAEFNIELSEQEIDQQMHVLFQKAGSKQEIEAYIHDLYKWNLDEFTEKIIKPYTLARKLDDYLLENLESNQQALQRAEQVYDKVKVSDESFEDLARQYSEDENNADNGGDLGYIERGMTVSVFEDAAFDTQVGEISELIKTESGYHILYIVDKQGDSEQIKKVHVKHILIKIIGADEYVDQLRKKIEIKKYI